MFPDDLIKQTWEKAGGQCECSKRTHSHFYVPCAKPLVWENRGKRGWGGWEIKLLDENKGMVLSNCEIVCITCNEMTY